MTISLSNVTVSLGAPIGSVIGALNTDTISGPTARPAFVLSEQQSYFAIDPHDNLIVSARFPQAGFYAISIYAVENNYVTDGGDFVIAVTPVHP